MRSLINGTYRRAKTWRHLWPEAYRLPTACCWSARACMCRRQKEGTGGVGYERLVVTAEVVGSINTIKFIPIVRNNTGARKVPNFLGPRMYLDFSDDAEYPVKLEALMREIHQA